MQKAPRRWEPAAFMTAFLSSSSRSITGTKVEVGRHGGEDACRNSLRACRWPP